MNSIIQEFPKDGETTINEATAGRARRIDAILKQTGSVTREQYQEALEYSSSG